MAKKNKGNKNTMLIIVGIVVLVVAAYLAFNTMPKKAVAGEATTVLTCVDSDYSPSRTTYDTFKISSGATQYTNGRSTKTLYDYCGSTNPNYVYEAVCNGNTVGYRGGDNCKQFGTSWTCRNGACVSH
jgi:hypothetical protein